MLRYSWNAREYAKHSASQQQWARELIDKLTLNGNEDVLDIGCGDGKVTAEIAGRLPVGRIVGLDNSPEMLRLAQESFPCSAHPNLSFILQNAAALELSDLSAQFDVVFSNAALHWLLDHRPVLAGIKKVLRPGGRLLLQMGGRGNAAGIVRILDAMMKEKKWSPYFSDFAFPYGFHDSKAYCDWAEEAGLQVKRCELIPKKMRFCDQAGLKGWIRTTWMPYTRRLPEPLQEKFISSLAVRYVAEHHCSAADAAIEVGMVRLELEALKP